MSIVPLCLYENFITKTSYLGLPVKTRQSDSDVFLCENVPDCRLLKTFYVINPDMAVFPTGLDLIGIKNSDSGFYTENVSQLYDPFHYEENTIRFLAWLEPTPHAIPLYVLSSGNSIIITLNAEQPNQFSPLGFSPIYVLDNPDMKFYNYQGRCLPDFSGIDLVTS